MHRLRHPIRSITEPFGKAGLIVAILALVLATTGAAFAAAGLSSKQKKEVTKIAKKYAGKPGINGANGTNGSNGAAGEKGAPGAPGEPGKDGESVKVTESANAAIEGHCTGAEASPVGKGGSKFEVGASKAYACNGKEGSPWTAGGTLPSGKTETGDFASIGVAAEVFKGSFLVHKYLSAPIPFTLPLASPIAGSNVHLIGQGEGEGEGNENPAIAAHECTGTSKAPGAAGGNLCLFLFGEANLDLNREETSPGVFGPPRLALGHTFDLTPCEFGAGACTTGTTLLLSPEAGNETEPIFVSGTWAVTAE